MKKITHGLFLAAAIVCFGCSNTPTTPTPTTADKGYYPLTDGSSWVYTLNFDNKYTKTFTISGSQMLDGKNYMLRSTEDKQGFDTTYWRRSNDTVFMLNRYSNTEDIFSIERLGAKWEYLVDNERQDTNRYMVIQKGISRTVGGKVFNDVLVLQNEYIGGSNSGEYSIMQFYFAKNIGLIEFATDDVEGFTLKSYTVK